MIAVPIRREGFAGQHLIVVPTPVRQAATKHPLLRGLIVTDAGYFPAATGHRVERPQGASTHLLILCLQGRGWARTDGRTMQLAAGDALWLPAEKPHAYGADKKMPWTIVWAHFRGDEVPFWQEQLGWANHSSMSSTRFDADRVKALGLDQVYARLESGYSHQHLLSASTALRATFCKMLDLAIGSGSIRTAAERTAAVRETIIAAPQRRIWLSELAIAAGLSVPQFSLLFRRQTGFAPIDFLIRQRVRLACRLLDTTQKAISEIAEEAGFNDPYYFSRSFHRIMGLSPRAYRKAVKG